jgi:hypothetical protein
MVQMMLGVEKEAMTIAIQIAMQEEEEAGEMTDRWCWSIRHSWVSWYLLLLVERCALIAKQGKFRNLRVDITHG